jgi:hypothetical protein
VAAGRGEDVARCPEPGDRLGRAKLPGQGLGEPPNIALLVVNAGMDGQVLADEFAAE